jgi:putative ABC transport system permease protein
VEQAQTDLNGIAAELRRDLPNHLSGWNAGIVPLREFWFGWSRGPLVMLESGLILVLLIACANVSTLLLARLPARQAEITMRVLLGAGRGRIVRQFLTESLLLSLMAGALGVLIAWWSVSSLEAIPPPVARMPISVLTQTTSISGLAVVLSLISSLMFGLLPALVAFSSGSDVRQANVHRRSGNLSGILVSTQVGLALVLLVSSGLLINSFVRLVLDDRGFDPKNILTFEYRIPVKDYVRNLGSFRGLPASDAAPPTEAIQRVHERLKTLPGIESVGGSSVRPVNGLTVPRAVVLADGKPLPASTSERENATVFYFLVTDNFFDTLKARIARGRDFSATDTRGAPWVAVINETMANHFWPGEDPIGKRFTIDAAAGEQPREVIGVVRDVALQYIRTGPAQPAAYTPYLQQPDHYRGQNANMFGQMTFFIRSPHEPSVVASAAREAVEEVDPRQPRATVQMLTDFLGGGIRTRGFYASALGVFALMATLMAAFGVYGVMSSSVSQRKREIGIHMAMGASARDIVRIVGGRAARLVAIGLFFGFLGSLVLAQSLRADVWGITSTDPATFAVVILFLTLVSSVACFIPARRAMRVDPTEALRVD